MYVYIIYILKINQQEIKPIMSKISNNFKTKIIQSAVQKVIKNNANIKPKTSSKKLRKYSKTVFKLFHISK